MSKTLFLLGWVLATMSAAGSAAADDWADFVAHSDRTANTTIVLIIDSGDLQTQTRIAEALGRRADPDVTEIIQYLSNRSGQRPRYQSEYLLRILLSSMMQASAADTLQRLRANAATLDPLIRELPDIQDPQTCALLVQAAAMLDFVAYAPYLAAEASSVIARVGSQNGETTPQQGQLLTILLESLDSRPSSDFLEIFHRAERTSIDAGVVDAAREGAQRAASGS